MSHKCHQKVNQQILALTFMYLILHLQINGDVALTRPTAATGQKAYVVGSSLRKHNTKPSIENKLRFFTFKNVTKGNGIMF